MNQSKHTSGELPATDVKDCSRLRKRTGKTDAETISCRGDGVGKRGEENETGGAEMNLAKHQSSFQMQCHVPPRFKTKEDALLFLECFQSGAEFPMEKWVWPYCKADNLGKKFYRLSMNTSKPSLN